MKDAVETSTALALPDEKVIVAAFAEPEKMENILARIEKEARSIAPDTSTAKGRKEITSLAYKVTRSKTTIDETGKLVKEEAQKVVNATDEQRRLARARLDALAAEIRVPLIEWEKAEKDRKEALNDRLCALRAPTVPGTVAEMEAERERIAAVEIGDDWQEFKPDAERLKLESLERLDREIPMVRQREEEQAELARLRKAEEDRLAREEAERAEREAQEAKRQAEIDAARREAEEARAEAERLRQEAEAERKRIENEKRAEAVRQEARRQLVADLRTHIMDCGDGLIGGAGQPLGILIYELESKVPPEIARVGGDEAAELDRLRIETIAALRETEEKKRKADAERAAKAEEEKRKAAEKDRKARAKKVREEIAESIVELFDARLGLGEAGVIADAIIAGKVRHVEVAA